ncbi:MAG: hypothetical protein KBT22_06825, partial [Bacteroidales bacterium]|nr:hypothetical protein [Candidatus Scybalocola fimicaballi]
MPDNGRKKKLLTEPAKDDWWDVDSEYLKSFLQLFATNQPVAAAPTSVAMPQQPQRQNLQTIQAGHTITTHSIRGCNDEQQQNFVVAVKENKVEREVTKASLESARINIYNEWRDQQRSQEAGLISTFKFELVDIFKILIKVPSKDAYQKLNGNFRINLLNALKNHLSNSKIEVQYSIDENVAKEQVLTNKQKFDALLKSSPLVQMLMNELDLVY